MFERYIDGYISKRRKKKGKLPFRFLIEFIEL